MCAGVVPQQPPTMDAPAWWISASFRPKYSGVPWNTVLRPCTVG